MTDHFAPPLEVASSRIQGDLSLAKNPYSLLLARILEVNPAFETNARHHLAYKIHENLVLSGFVLDLSGLEHGAFYLTAFSQPLYVPHDYLFLTYGKRLVRGKRWKIDSHNETEVVKGVLEAIRSEGRCFLEMVNSTKKIAELAEAKPRTRQNPFRWHGDDPNVIETRAYSWTLVGNEINARRDLLYLTRQFVPSLAWERELQNRSETVLRSLDAGLETARELLQTWARQTIVSLKLVAAPRSPSS